MPGKRRFIVNGVAVSMETPQSSPGPEKKAGGCRCIYVSHSEAVGRWGLSTADEVWRGLGGEDTVALVTAKQDEQLGETRDDGALTTIIADVVAQSAVPGKDR